MTTRTVLTALLAATVLVPPSLHANSSQPLDLDHDALFTTMADELAWWDTHGHLRTLPALQTATGQELNGLHVDPGFAAGGYELDGTSQLIDAGLIIPGVNHDFVGLGPDIGAFEASTVIFADGFESGSSDLWTGLVTAPEPI